MHEVIFFPVGNGDTSVIKLANGKWIMMDFCHRIVAEDDDDPRINLQKCMRDDLTAAGKKSLDVLALTHADDDHIAYSTDFFELQHAKKYQGNGRVPIDVLWVPAAMVLADCESADSDEAIWCKEAQYRLKAGKGIRVFSKPDKLKDWLDGNDIDVKDRLSVITDAGKVVPGLSLDNDGVEFFCHSPFIKHVDGEDDVLRNPSSLIFNVRFRAGKNTYDYLAIGDSECAVLEDIVAATKFHGNDDRLQWDIFNIPHHCSYLALSSDKGDKETTPVDGVKELLLCGRNDAFLVCSSNPIRDTQEAREQVQPPHVQAKKCYETYLKKVGGRSFLVTMEQPNEKKPEPLVFTIAEAGVSRKKVIRSGPAIITSSDAPRAG